GITTGVGSACTSTRIRSSITAVQTITASQRHGIAEAFMPGRAIDHELYPWSNYPLDLRRLSRCLLSCHPGVERLQPGPDQAGAAVRNPGAPRSGVRRQGPAAFGPGQA